MEDPQKKAGQDLTALSQWMNKVLALAYDITNNVKYSDDDHLAFMALCFLGKQIDHTKSILTLMPSTDVVLISRSMLEGLCQLLWASQDPTVRPLRWRAFALIHDWRVLQAKIAKGEQVDSEQRADIENALKEHGNQFLTPTALKALGKGETLPPDPYCNDWRTGRQIKQTFEMVKGEVLYQEFYKPFSDWHHWGAGGLGKVIKIQNNRVAYLPRNPSDSEATLAIAIQCLLQTVTLINAHLNIEFATKIAELRDGYIAWGEKH